jgi:hypothetical protein
LSGCVDFCDDVAVKEALREWPRAARAACLRISALLLDGARRKALVQ